MVCCTLATLSQAMEYFPPFRLLLFFNCTALPVYNDVRMATAVFVVGLVVGSLRVVLLCLVTACRRCYVRARIEEEMIELATRIALARAAAEGWTVYPPALAYASMPSPATDSPALVQYNPQYSHAPNDTAQWYPHPGNMNDMVPQHAPHFVPPPPGSKVPPPPPTIRMMIPPPPPPEYGVPPPPPPPGDKQRDW